MLYDKDIRAKLYAELRMFASKKSLIINEFGIWNNRIDVAVVEDYLNGYEIKSDGDSLIRLPKQESLYSKVFDYITIICTGKHLNKIEALVPEQYGIIEVIDDFQIEFCTRRTPHRNSNIDKKYLAGILWKSERLAVLDRYGLSQSMKCKNRGVLLDKLCEHLSLSQIHSEVIDILKHREWDDKRIGVEIIK